jgi:hypothetical protein
VATVTDREKRSEGIQKALTQLDLHYHSLRLAGEKMAADASELATDELMELQDRVLHLVNTIVGQLTGLRDLLTDDDLDSWQSLMNRIAVASSRVSRAKTKSLVMVNTWRVIEAVDGFLDDVGPRYGYARVGTALGLEPGADDESEASALDRLFAEYGNTMAAETGVEPVPGPPFQFGVLRWRGSQLFYVERAEDGARWIELDPDEDPRSLGEEPGGVEAAEARSIDGYPIRLMLDVEVDERELDAYVRDQKGLEYFMSGYQVAAEQEGKRGSRGRRRG